MSSVVGLVTSQATGETSLGVLISSLSIRANQAAGKQHRDIAHPVATWGVIGPAAFAFQASVFVKDYDVTR